MGRDGADAAHAGRVLTGAVATLGVVLGLLTGCASEQPAQGGVSVPTLTGELTRYRRDEALRRVQVKLGQADGEQAASVRSLRLTLPGYADGPVSEIGSQSRPGSVVDLPVVLGDPLCPSAGAPTTRADVPAGSTVAVATVDTADGPREVTIDLTDPDEVGPQTWSRECSALAALDAAPIELGTTWARTGPDGALSAAGGLAVGPVAPGRAVTVLEVLGTTLFSTTIALPVEVGAGDRVVLPLTVAPARCDPHAVGESKRGYAFGVRVAVDGGDPVLVTVEPTEAERVQMEDVLLEQCGLD